MVSITMFNGNITYFDWAMFNTLIYQRVNMLKLSNLTSTYPKAIMKLQKKIGGYSRII